MTNTNIANVQIMGSTVQVYDARTQRVLTTFDMRRANRKARVLCEEWCSAHGYELDAPVLAP